MTMRASRLLAACLLVVALPVAHAAGVEVTAVESAPSELKPEFREALATGFRVSIDGKTAAELWPAKEIAETRQEKAILGARFGQVAEGGLVGIVRFPEKWSDFRGKPVAAGTYAMRYGIEPADGNHMGVSEYRDFLLLVPIASDVGPKSFPAGDALYAASRKASGTNHPAVMSLVPAPAGATAPSASSGEGMVTASFKAGTITLAVVLKGHAQE